MTNREERLIHREKNGFMIVELREVLREYFTIYEIYGLNRYNQYEIKLFDKTNNKDTNFSITMKSYSDDYFASDIGLEWFKSDREKAYKKIEWGNREDYSIYDYFIVDHSIGYRKMIKKENILGFILNFITKYNPAFGRDLKLSNILDNNN